MPPVVAVIGTANLVFIIVIDAVAVIGTANLVFIIVIGDRVVLDDGCRVGQAELKELRASIRVRQDQDLPVLCLDGSQWSKVR